MSHAAFAVSFIIRQQLSSLVVRTDVDDHADDAPLLAVCVRAHFAEELSSLDFFLDAAILLHHFLKGICIQGTCSFHDDLFLLIILFLVVNNFVK